MPSDTKRYESGEAGEAHWDLSVEHIPALLEHFLAFRGRWFRTPRGRPYLTPPFQQRWVEAILRALVTGGRQIILSPPRHGKSELLIHVCVADCAVPEHSDSVGGGE